MIDIMRTHPLIIIGGILQHEDFTLFDGERSWVLFFETSFHCQLMS